MNNASFCLSCDKRETCKEICPELEKTLPKVRGGGHRKEFMADEKTLEYLHTEQQERERGKRIMPHIYED